MDSAAVAANSLSLQEEVCNLRYSVEAINFIFGVDVGIDYILAVLKVPLDEILKKMQTLYRSVRHIGKLSPAVRALWRTRKQDIRFLRNGQCLKNALAYLAARWWLFIKKKTAAAAPIIQDFQSKHNTRGLHSCKMLFL